MMKFSIVAPFVVGLQQATTPRMTMPVSDVDWGAPGTLLILSGICVVGVFSLHRLARRRLARTVKRVPPVWSEIDSYTELTEAAYEWRSLSPDAFLDGPFRRYVELALIPRDSPLASARIMEFCRGSIAGFAKELGQRGGDGAAVERRARTLAEAWFAGTPHADYLIEVLDGVSNHNYRTTRTQGEGGVQD